MDEDSQLRIGQPVFDRSGRELGTVRGLSEAGFVVSVGDDIEALSVEHARAGPEYGEAELVWRCLDCGEIGEIDTFPEQCPSCGAERESLYYWVED